MIIREKKIAAHGMPWNYQENDPMTLFAFFCLLFESEKNCAQTFLIFLLVTGHSIEFS
jgi:hypothetical protein